MGKIKDMTGQVFGRLTVLHSKGTDSSRGVLWCCLCSCGKKIITRGGSLRSGSTRSCGCLNAINSYKHGQSQQRTPEYESWRAMISRCATAVSNPDPDYAGRGITVCERWRGEHGFENFLVDMGERPEGKTIDRIEVNGNYEPDNCRWATGVEQQANRRIKQCAS